MRYAIPQNEERFKFKSLGKRLPLESLSKIQAKKSTRKISLDYLTAFIVRILQGHILDLMALGWAFLSPKLSLRRMEETFRPVLVKDKPSSPLPSHSKQTESAQ